MIIGIGCDITNVTRFKNKDEHFIKLILSPEETNLYHKKLGKQKAEFLAGRFCAKEAIIKALPDADPIAMWQINITYKDNKPYCLIKDYNIKISISHEGNYAISYVIITKN